MYPAGRTNALQVVYPYPFLRVPSHSGLHDSNTWPSNFIVNLFLVIVEDKVNFGTLGSHLHRQLMVSYLSGQYNTGGPFDGLPAHTFQLGALLLLVLMMFYLVLIDCTNTCLQQIITDTHPYPLYTVIYFVMNNQTNCTEQKLHQKCNLIFFHTDSKIKTSLWCADSGALVQLLHT